MTIITTSWDDGDALDMRVAEMLDRYGMKGTFYIARDYRPRRISDDMIRGIAKRHEIGAHTLSHPNLTTVTRDEKHREVAQSKQWLENITGKPVEMFCYPGGRYDLESIEVVRESGFIGARTTEKKMPRPFDPYRMPVSMTWYPFPFSHVDRVCAGYRKAIEPLASILPPALSGESWQSHKILERHVLEIFEQTRAQNGVFHLYGHSWANTRYGLWPVLERVLSSIAGRPDCRYLTNAEALRVMTAQ